MTCCRQITHSPRSGCGLYIPEAAGLKCFRKPSVRVEMHLHYLLVFIAFCVTRISCQLVSDRNEGNDLEHALNELPKAPRIARRSPSLEETRQRIRYRKPTSRSRLRQGASAASSGKADPYFVFMGEESQRLARDYRKEAGLWRSLEKKRRTLSKANPERLFTESRWKHKRARSKALRGHRRNSRIRKTLLGAIERRIEKVRMSTAPYSGHPPGGSGNGTSPEGSHRSSSPAGEGPHGEHATASSPAQAATPLHSMGETGRLPSGLQGQHLDLTHGSPGERSSTHLYQHPEFMRGGVSVQDPNPKLWEELNKHVKGVKKAKGDDDHIGAFFPTEKGGSPRE